MSEKRGTDTQVEKTLRIEGAVPVARLKELLGREPALKLETVAPRKPSPSSRADAAR
jgi:hypothetical protein